MTGWCRWLFLVLLAQTLNYGHAARILGLYPMASRSHHVVIDSLMKELATRGHDVTVVSSFPLEKSIANYSNINVEFDMYKLIGGQTSISTFGKSIPFSVVYRVLYIGEMISKHTFENKKVQEIINSRDHLFDLVVLEDFGNEALAGIAHVFNAPLIYFNSAVGFIWTNDLVGNPSSTSFIPSIFLSYTDHMTFTERLHNTLHHLFEEFYYNLIFIPRQDALMRKHLKQFNLPHLSEINAKTSLVLTNVISGINYPRPLLPNIIQVGGLHITSPKPLPQDLKQFLDDADNGVVYFSMGSFLKSADFPVHIRESFLKAFAKLKQKVLWKFELDNMPGQPSNVWIKNWLPQNDVLAHPNVKLFITHGGLLSNQEAVYHGVPLIGIPILGDQKLNMRNSERLGYGIIMEMSNITETSVEWALNEALNNPRYTERVKVVSKVFRDQPQTPLQRAVYWTEYVIRHKGAPHLRSAALDLAWYQYLLLDVIAVLLLSVLTVISVIVFTCKKLCGFKKNKSVDLKKKNM